MASSETFSPAAAGTVVVAGSLNVDHTLLVRRLPAPGETVHATGALTCFGGKGANQAVAAARAGARVEMIGCVGVDAPGGAYLEHLAGEGVGTGGTVKRGDATGSAFILVDELAENCIVVNAGANGLLTAGDVEAAADRIGAADVLLLQLEIPLEAVSRAAGIARSNGVRVVLNPSPWNDEVLTAGIPVDVLVVNEHEAARWLGDNWEGVRANPAAALKAAGCDTVVVTRGASPTWVLGGREGLAEVAGFPVTPVDTVGAGDAFTGALAVALAGGRSIWEAVAFANAAGALATQKRGAQSAIPFRAEIEARVADNATPDRLRKLE